MDLDDSENKAFRSDLKAPSEMDPFEIHLIITQKTKTVQDRLAGVPPNQWPPAKMHLHVTTCPYTATELMDLVKGFQQELRESIPAWLLRLWGSGAESIMVNRPEISKLGSITLHPRP